MKITAQLLDDLIGGSHEALLNGIAPVESMSYLVEGRGLLLSTIKCFNIGFCTEEIEKLINRNYYDGLEPYPNIVPEFIRNRIIVPICDDNDNVVAIASRGLGKGQVWWNTPFSKGNYLFNLSRARSKAFKDNKIYIVEGYMDALILFQKGLYNVVASMGTRFTMVHVGLVRRYCDRLCLCFDADPSKKIGSQGAGQLATSKTHKLISPYFGLTTIRLPLKYINNTPVACDPDDFVLENGLASLLSLEKEEQEVERNEFRN